MKEKLKTFMRAVRPLRREEQEKLKEIKQFIQDDQFSRVLFNYRQKNISLAHSSVETSELLDISAEFPQLVLINEDHILQEFVNSVNDAVQKKVEHGLYRAFSRNPKRIKSIIAPNIMGLDEIKDAVMLQLFSTDHVHVLLLGDPGTGKTQILHAASELSPISSFGLGSGTSAAGLSVVIKGKEILKGLLPQADNGLCAIDELNLMKSQDYAALYNAMEKGFISYDKGGIHQRLDARVSVLATANPKGDRFVGKSVEMLKKQLPFDPALLSRFNLAFLVRKPGLEEFKEISRKIVRDQKVKVNENDKKFVRGYLEFAQKIEVDFPKRFEKRIIELSEEIKKNEKRYLVEISPRLVIGIIRFAKASARMHLRKQVNDEDFETVKKLVLRSLDVK